MRNDQDATVTLTVDKWKSIMEMIMHSCRLKGGDWIKWGENINLAIKTSIGEKAGSHEGVQLIPVYSEKITFIGYDSKKKILEIRFDNGEVRQYHSVPPTTYASMLKAESPWKYFFYNIQYIFYYEKVGFQPLPLKKTEDYISEVDSDCNEEPVENYSLRDLQNDLGMDFMSQNEFVNWLEDSGDRE